MTEQELIHKIEWVNKRCSLKGELLTQSQIELLKFVLADSVCLHAESIKLLRDLADLQNGAPLEQHRQEWEETMERVYDHLNRWEGE